MEFRKHNTQFTNEENEILISILKRRTLKLTAHARERMTEKHISMLELNQAMKNFEIVEFHYKDGDCRLLIKSKPAFGNRNIKLVISMNNNQIITTYANSKNDNHATLDWTLYNSNINLIKYLTN